MLERFKVPKQDEVRIPEDSLRQTVAEGFELRRGRREVVACRENSWYVYVAY